MQDDVRDEPPIDQPPQETSGVLGRLRKLAPFGFGVLATLFAVLLYNALTSDSEGITADEVEVTVADALASVTPPPARSAQVYQTILPSLVVVRVESPTAESGFGVGSGVIIDAGGAILTSLHVVDTATSIEVRFADGTRSLAAITAAQPENDIAVLTPTVPPGEFLPATLGSSQRMQIGDEVFAVGNPLGLAGSISAGVISGLDRAFTPSGSERRFEGVIQFDAAVNPGNSGGPLLNTDGHVVGIVTGLVNPTDQEVFIGIGFAVPIGVAAQVAGGPRQ